MTRKLDKNKLVELLQEQAEIGATPNGGLNRVALTAEDKAIRDWFCEKLQEEGIKPRIDAIGNVFGRREGRKEGAEPILIGSHLDSQPRGGRYDGALGAISGLAILKHLNEHQIETERPIEVVNWSQHEGARFQPAMMGSGVWAGEHELTEELQKMDDDGITVAEALETIGYRGETPAEPAETYHCYLELHIEQTPYLDETDTTIGIVEGVVGFRWGRITYYGNPDGTGPTPMYDREDALVAAADVITQIRRMVSTLGEQTYATSGYLSVDPNSVNVVPGEVTFSWDVRDPDQAVVEEGAKRILEEAAFAADREGIEWENEIIMDHPRIDFSKVCKESIASATEDLGYSSRNLMSRAGHDASHLPAVCDTGMIFVPSEDGITHSEEEYTSWEDCHKGANVLLNAVLNLA